MNTLIGLCMTVAGIIIIRYIFDILAPDGGIKKYINLILSITFTLLVMTKILSIKPDEVIDINKYKYYTDKLNGYSADYDDVLSHKFADEIESDAKKYIEDKYGLKINCNVKIESDIHNKLMRISEINILSSVSDGSVKKEIADDIAQRYATEVTVR